MSARIFLLIGMLAITSADASDAPLPESIQTPFLPVAIYIPECPAKNSFWNQRVADAAQATCAIVGMVLAADFSGNSQVKLMPYDAEALSRMDVPFDEAREGDFKPSYRILVGMPYGGTGRGSESQAGGSLNIMVRLFMATEASSLGQISDGFQSSHLSNGWGIYPPEAGLDFGKKISQGVMKPQCATKIANAGTVVGDILRRKKLICDGFISLNSMEPFHRRSERIKLGETRQQVILREAMKRNAMRDKDKGVIDAD